MLVVQRERRADGSDSQVSVSLPELLLHQLSEAEKCLAAARETAFDGLNEDHPEKPLLERTAHNCDESVRLIGEAASKVRKLVEDANE